MKIYFYMDKNKDYKVEIEYRLNTLVISFILLNQAEKLFYVNILPHLKFIINRENLHFYYDRLLWKENRYENRIHNFILSIPINIKVCLWDTILFNSDFNSNDEDLIIEHNYHLCVSITRLISAGYYAERPLKIEDATKNQPITDLHTHFDAILSSEILLKTALEKNVQINIADLIACNYKKYNFLNEELIGKSTISIIQLKLSHPAIYQQIRKNLNIPTG